MSRTIPAVAGVVTAGLVGLVRLYQYTLAGVLGGRCRFYPTCSVYAVEALKLHGPARGLALTLRRLARCHPLGGAGVDPVPDPRPPSPASASGPPGEDPACRCDKVSVH